MACILRKGRHNRPMIKYILLALFVVAIAFGAWFYSKTDPQKLDFADRFWAGQAEYDGAPIVGIAYGKDERQKLDVYTPTGKSGGAYPVLVFFHGGAWREGERDGYGFLGRAFAARGIVTIIADYRKTPQVKFPAFVEDAASSIAWAHNNAAKYHGDPAKLYIMGHSAGAHIAMMAALDKQWLAKDGLDPSVIAGVIGLAGPYDFLPLTTDSSKLALGHWPRPEETQPITYARVDAPPMLLLTGDIDTVVKPRNSKILAAKITELGGKASLKTYPKVDHADIIMALSRAFRNKADVLKDVTGFIKTR
jgi:acetyl esterase/lipase